VDGSQGRLGSFIDGVEIVELGLKEVGFNALTTVVRTGLGAK
jgi:hypothetical protein